MRGLLFSCMNHTPLRVKQSNLDMLVQWSCGPHRSVPTHRHRDASSVWPSYDPCLTQKGRVYSDKDGALRKYVTLFLLGEPRQETTFTPVATAACSTHGIHLSLAHTRPAPSPLGPQPPGHGPQ